MRSHVQSSALILIAGIVSQAGIISSANAQDPEFRAMWITRFEWPNFFQPTIQQTIDNIMDDLSAANFNVAIFQVRGQMDVFFPSPNETWSELIGGSDPGWDPLAYAINAAHTRGLEFHAYVNTHTCWHSRTFDPPLDPNHLYYQHCNANDPNGRDWLLHDNFTTPSQYLSDNYVWVAPGVPAASAHTRQQVLYIVENYDIDGIHFDRIRTPSVTSRDPISFRRQNESRTNPHGLNVDDWTAGEITRLVRDTYAAIKIAKPHVTVSAAVIPDYPNTNTRLHQAPIVWGEHQALDIAIPMMYSSTAWFPLWMFATSQLPMQVAGGFLAFNGDIQESRDVGAVGTSLFSWSSFFRTAEFLSGPYATPVATPSIPWESSPESAILGVEVLSVEGDPVEDVEILVLAGGVVVDQTLTSADGFCGLTGLDAGSFTLKISHPGYKPLTQVTPVLAEGDAILLRAQFNELAAVGDFDDDGDADLADWPWMQFCFGGPESLIYPDGHSCLNGDGDSDQDVDVLDFARFQADFEPL